MTTKSLAILDPDRSAQSGTESIIEWVESLEIVLPKLSPMALQSQSFDFYDASIQPGAPTAAALAAGIMALPELDQKTAAARRSEWSRSRCVEYLRFQAAVLNKELTEVAERTKSDAVRVSVIDAIYGAVVASYPHLKNEAADMAVRKKLELARNGKNGAAVSQLPEPESVAPIIAPEASKTTLAEAKADAAADGKADMVQIINTQLAALRLVHRYLVPAAAAEGITIDALQANGLVQNLLIQSYYQRTHQKFSRTKIEVSK
jgi:hypothetical protein